MFCFYGGSPTIPRTHAIEYFPIVMFLRIDALAQQLRNDMVSSISSYNVFELFELAYRYNEQKIF